MKTTPSTASAGPPRVQCTTPIQASSRKNVRWMRTAVPPTSNSLIDQPMENPRCGPLGGIMRAFCEMATLWRVTRVAPPP